MRAVQQQARGPDGWDRRGVVAFAWLPQSAEQLVQCFMP